MRYPPGDPPILSAEIYDPGLPLLKRRFAIKTNAALDDMRKRAKSSQPESAEPPKRPRGRPRLETKDETAAEVSSLSSLISLRPETDNLSDDAHKYGSPKELTGLAKRMPSMRSKPRSSNSKLRMRACAKPSCNYMIFP